ncbi:MAG: hypothetical protein ACTSP8_11485, partial [Promethearchaeota archaeon]
SKVEDENKELLKQQKEESLRKNRGLLNSYIERELQIIAESNVKTIKEANGLIEKEEFLKAANLVKSQADFWSIIGRKEIQDQMLKKVLDILLIGKLFDKFTNVYYDLTNKSKKNYLRNKLNLVKKKLKEFANEDHFENVFTTCIFFLSIYREQLLFEQSKEISELTVDFVKSEALRVVKENEDKKTIDSAINLIAKAKDLSNAYLDKREINFDEIYAIIVRFFIKLYDFSSARANNDKILNKSLKAKGNKAIEKKQSDISAKDAKKAQKDYDESILKERGPIIRKRARDAEQDRQDDLRLRTGLRAVYDKGLNLLKNLDYENALEEYNAQLVGISLAVSLLILYKLNRIEEFEKSLSKIKKSLGSLEKSFKETFPVTLLDYIIDIEKLRDVIKFKEALQFVEFLALFDEELDLLNELLDKSKKPIDSEDIEHLIVERGKRLKIIQELEKQILKEKRDIAKRKLMKNQYWKISYEDLCNGKFKVACNEYDDTISKLLDTISKLLDKGFFKPAAVSLIIATILMVKTKNISLAKSYLNDLLTRYSKYKKDFGDLPEIQILNELLYALENKDDEQFDLCLKILTNKLVLFECEIDLLKSLVHKEQQHEVEEAKMSREELAKEKKLNIQLDQNFGILQKKMPDIRREQQEHLKKRNFMKNRIYTEVIALLEKNSFKDAGIEYLKLAYTLSKRKNFESSSLMVLLHGLALLVVKVPLKEIRININSYLSSLGLNKKLLEDTFPIRCIDFLLNVITHNVEKYKPTIKELLDILPLFEEEKYLIDNLLKEEGN